MRDTFQNRVMNSIESAIARQIEEEKELFIKSAVAEFEGQIRRTVAGVVMRIHDFYSVERLEAEPW